MPKSLDHPPISSTIRMMPSGIVLLFTSSFLLNFGVPYSYYLYVTHHLQQSFDPHWAINRYLSGMIGDAICAPFINTFLFLTYFDLKIDWGMPLVAICLLSGLLVTALLHLVQAKMKLTNWSMPQPWKWNFPGKYHMFSATVQFGFLTFSLYTIGKNWTLITEQPQRLLYVLLALSFALLFNLTFARDTLLPATNPNNDNSDN